MSIANQLLEINRRFYSEFGPFFSATRLRIQPGVRRTIETLEGSEKILDLGCGNGELSRQLVSRGHTGFYLGLDFSLPLLQDAILPLESIPFNFQQFNLSDPDWEEVTPYAPFDRVFAFATLHHIPGQELRINILCQVHEMLALGGMFIHSEWQFLNSERLKRRIQPWQIVNLASDDVDGGDYLLDWRQGGLGLRYVHHFTESELVELAHESGFIILETFYSDGLGGRLGLYQVWEKR
ncbi:MAG: methyltransferase domain-containing protein [Anaerolineales bacterium]|nr:methyltransferase domain-containing protein [Anaerolineales bacterium]